MGYVAVFAVLVASAVGGSVHGATSSLWLGWAAWGVTVATILVTTSIVVAAAT